MQSERLTPGDLVGCRYRQVQRIRFPEIAPLEASLQRRARREAGLAEVMGRLPQTPRKRGRTPFERIDLDPDEELAEFSTLEAIAAQASVITGAVFTGELDGVAWEVVADILVRTPEGTYMPVMVSNHRVARANAHQKMQAIATSRLGLGKPLTVSATLRHHTIDGYRLALTLFGLDEAGAGDMNKQGAVIGQDRDWAYLVDIPRYTPAAQRALLAPPPTGPRRVKECANCRFWPTCEPELRAADEISLFNDVGCTFVI